MAVTDWSTTPANNSTIDGINIAEGCAAANLNGAVRSVMASTRVAFDSVPVASQFMPRAGGIFSEHIYRAGFGCYMFNSDPGAVSGRWIVQPVGAGLPAMANGDWLVEVE